jgi:hypothetical protein
MSMEIGFLKAVRIAVFALVIVLVVLVILALFNVLSAEVGISLYNLLVDVAVGVFTVWGLYWAASEFAKAQVEPDLHLIIGTGRPNQAGVEALKGAADPLLGWEGVFDDGKPVSWVVVGLLWENHRPKAGQYIRIELWVSDDVPCPKFVIDKEVFVFPIGHFSIEGSGIVLQFGEDFVAYGDAGGYLGKILMEWPQSICPERITFKAKLFSLESSKPKEVTISHPIHWTEETA